jgi:hypothetical protein
MFGKSNNKLNDEDESSPKKSPTNKKKKKFKEEEEGLDLNEKEVGKVKTKSKIKVTGKED